MQIIFFCIFKQWNEPLSVTPSFYDAPSTQTAKCWWALQKNTPSSARNISPVASSQKLWFDIGFYYAGIIINNFIMQCVSIKADILLPVRDREKWEEGALARIVWASGAPLIWKLLDEAALRCASRKCLRVSRPETESRRRRRWRQRWGESKSSRQFSANIVFVRALSILGGKDCLFMSECVLRIRPIHLRTRHAREQ